MEQLFERLQVALVLTMINRQAAAVADLVQ